MLMLKTPRSLQGYILSFLSGALISFLGAHAYQIYVSEHRQNRPPGGHRQRSFFVATTTRRRAIQNAKDNPEKGQCGLRDDQGNKMMDSPNLDYRLIRKAEAVIQGRTSRLLIVVERCTNDHNYSAILRTAEALGVQNLWIIDPPHQLALGSDDVGIAAAKDQKSRPVKRSIVETTERVSHTLFAQRAQEWLSLRTFTTTAECLKALRQEGYQVWVTDLSQSAVPLDELSVPSRNVNDDSSCRLAIVMGTEAVGCSQEMLQGADLRVYLPLVGFADSLNLSVATALVIQYIMEFVYPSCKHAMDEAERQALRELWYPKLARQRLLTPHEKRDLKIMKKNIDECQRLQTKRDQGLALTESQEAKLQGRAELQARFDQVNARLDEKAHASVQHLLENPPEPLGDLRRADVHRVSYVGKSTKRTNIEFWKNMPAVAHAKALENSSCTDFRRGLLDLGGD